MPVRAPCQLEYPEQGADAAQDKNGRQDQQVNRGNRGRRGRRKQEGRHYVAGGAEGEEEKNETGEDEEGDTQTAPADFRRIALEATRGTGNSDRAHPAHPPKTRPARETRMR